MKLLPARFMLDRAEERGDQFKLRKAELNAFLSTADEPPPLLHPAMAQQYRLRIQQLYETLQDNCEEKRVEAANVTRSLVEDIVLTPVDGKVEIDVRGDLAGILTISVERKKPHEGALLGSQVKMVAEACTHLYLRSQQLPIRALKTLLTGNNTGLFHAAA